ncbi:MAG: PA2778 family cysteine peptidase [Alphaproteobacteria bacterium]
MPPLSTLTATGLPVRAELTSVPFFPQEALFCGPAALAMALAWSGLPLTQSDVADQVFTPGRGGTLRSDVLAAARRNGRLAVQLTELDDILVEIAAGHPVIVFQNLALEWFPQWHFAVAIGYDLERGEIILHSGRQIRRVTPLATFARTWDRGERWALVVLPPDVLPASAPAAPTLQAAAGIERAGRLDDAALAYAAILSRWPGSVGAQVGLGNTRYALGDLAGAEATLRDAIDDHPQLPMLWNNLAYVLADQGQMTDAIAAAEQAVLRSRNADAYRATLDELLARGI